MGRWSAEVASRFLTWLKATPDQRWLDVGCGTGALTRAIASAARPHLIVGLDPSWDFLRYARQLTSKASFVVAGGGALAFSDQSFDVVVSGLALNFIPVPEQALAEIYRVVKPGGVAAAYVWDYAGEMEFLRYFWDAAVALDASAASLHEGRRFPICQPEPLHQLWQRAGFHHIIVEAVDIPTVFDSFEHFWQPFTIGNFPAPMYASSLDDDQRDRLMAHLRATIPTAPDGTIHLNARAWAVTGSR
ncbi:MAG: class I SAM-dependent methyltransferase [Anaerolineae bacterium]|nr:class I SAM-dependent methyltransferase [Anaerolineae bacterium]